MRRTSMFRQALVAAIVALACQAGPAFADPAADTCAIHYPSDARIAWTCHRVTRGDTLASLFGKDWRDGLRFNRIDRRHVYPGVRLKVPVDPGELKDFTPLPASYEAAAGDAKFIFIDLSEQFLGAYAHGRLVMSFPISSGQASHPELHTPDGLFRVDAYDPRHESSVYDMEDSDRPYPMHYALRFLTTRQGVEVWIHGRDLPGYPASHGCVGLYDEAMQKEYYGVPRHPQLDAARRLYAWAIAPHPDDGHMHVIADGPPVLIVGRAP